MRSTNRAYRPPPIPDDPAIIQNELTEAHETIHRLLRQISKEQSRCAEVTRAYNKTVSSLVEATRENAALEHERDLWRARAESAAAPFQIGGLTLDLTPAEVSAIRKAMARLHHPDAGGDIERMKAWNAALDPLDD
ncbi:MAG TPA: hypothetical protein PKK15_26090 [Kouleothrix sp.]|uniref:hypothetical protein n=1 Tax=Kouleothrix sp. TaxID=2779161 RepID=UPI002C8B3A0B|nr:hypothetical protein [Kouleothrix sp.]